MKIVSDALAFIEARGRKGVTIRLVNKFVEKRVLKAKPDAKPAAIQRQVDGVIKALTGAA